MNPSDCCEDYVIFYLLVHIYLLRSGQGGFKMSSIPIWVFAVILLILFSGYMAVRAFLAERKLDRQFIEREGKIYMERIQKERLKKREQ